VDGQRYYSFGFRRYPLEVGAQYRSYMAMLEVAAVGLTDELAMKASSSWIVSVDGAIAIGQEILDSFCEILVSKQGS